MKVSLRGDFAVDKVQPLTQFDYLSFLHENVRKISRVELTWVEV